MKGAKMPTKKWKCANCRKSGIFEFDPNGDENKAAFDSHHKVSPQCKANLTITEIPVVKAK